MKRLVCLGVSVVAMLAWISSASAVTQQRSYVASNGVDTNDCSRAAPCLTFQRAHDQTDPGGELTCLDNSDYGPLNITKTITIDCGGTGATIVDAGSLDTIIINHNFVDVTIRNLNIVGNGTGQEGIHFTNGSSLNVENCRISGFGLNFGVGIHFTPANVAAKLHVADTLIQDSGNLLANTGGGIVIQPSGTGSALAVIERTTMTKNFAGLVANGTGSTGTVSVQVKDSVASLSTTHGFAAITAAGKATTAITLDRSSSLTNGNDGIHSEGSPAFVLIGNSTVSSNGTGLNSVSSGHIFSYQNNQLKGNISDGAATGVLPIN